jgi:putative oxidoreductase
MSAITSALGLSKTSAAETTDIQAWGIAFIRAIVGIVFLIHGGQKLFVYGVHNVAGMMNQLSIPMPSVAAAVVTWVEFLGGAALLFGVFTRVAALLLAFDMLVAVLKVHLKGGFFLPMGFEYALTLLVTNVALAMTGPGAAVVQNLFSRTRRNRSHARVSSV